MDDNTDPMAQDAWSWIADMGAAARTLLIWLALVIGGFVLGYALTHGLDLLAAHWPRVVAVLSN